MTVWVLVVDRQGIWMGVTRRHQLYLLGCEKKVVEDFKEIKSSYLKRILSKQIKICKVAVPNKTTFYLIPKYYCMYSVIVWAPEGGKLSASVPSFCFTPFLYFLWFYSSYWNGNFGHFGWEYQSYISTTESAQYSHFIFKLFLAAKAAQ